MKDNAKCFIFGSDGYEEITYAVLKEHRDTNPVFQKRRFIRSGEMLMEVRETDYKEFIRAERRQKYIEEEAIRAGEFSYDELDTDEMSGADILMDTSPPVDEQIADKLLLDTMRRCFEKLEQSEQELLTALYFSGKSERELAREMKIPDMTLNYRKRKILAKLKIMIAT